MRTLEIWERRNGMCQFRYLESGGRATAWSHEFHRDVTARMVNILRMFGPYVWHTTAMHPDGWEFAETDTPQ